MLFINAHWLAAWSATVRPKSGQDGAPLSVGVWVTPTVRSHPPVVHIGPIPHVLPLGIVSSRPSRPPSLPIPREGPLVIELRVSPSVRHELNRGPTTSPRAFYDSVPPTASCAKSEGARYHLPLRRFPFEGAGQV